MEKETKEINNNPFVDVGDGNRFKTPILWAYYEGITTGTGDGTTFSPEDECTRGQVVMFLYRFAGKPEHQRALPKEEGFVLPVGSGGGGRPQFVPYGSCSKRNSSLIYVFTEKLGNSLIVQLMLEIYPYIML